MSSASRLRRSARSVSGWSDDRWPSVDFVKPTTGADDVNGALTGRPVHPSLFTGFTEPFRCEGFPMSMLGPHVARESALRLGQNAP